MKSRMTSPEISPTQRAVAWVQGRATWGNAAETGPSELRGATLGRNSYYAISPRL